MPWKYWNESGEKKNGGRQMAKGYVNAFKDKNNKYFKCEKEMETEKRMKSTNQEHFNDIENTNTWRIS